MKHFAKQQLMTLLCVSNLLISSNAMATAFQLWEQDGASIGNFHAGYAALATDASTAFYNPAGITRIKNQQFVVGGVAITTDFKYKGLVSVVESPFTTTFPNVTAKGGNTTFIPALHYVTPINDKLGFGFSVTVPFGLKTDYGKDSTLRYVATKTMITAIDFSPSLGFQINDHTSIGAGIDIQKVNAKFNNVGTLIFFPNPTSTDTNSTSTADGTGYGYHLGGLYQLTPYSRIGLSYHSQVVHHLSGTSKFEGPIANVLNNGTLKSNHSTVNLTLPAYTALSGYHRIHPKIALMGSAIYTEWHTFKKLVLNNIAGATSVPVNAPSTTIQVSIPEHYINTWNFSFGADYLATDKLTLRSGIGYDQTPVRNAYRNVQLPDNDHYVIAIGGHYQASPTLGLDLGWAHLFIHNAKISPPPQVSGAQTVITRGQVTGGADVFGAQITWDIV